MQRDPNHSPKRSARLECKKKKRDDLGRPFLLVVMAGRLYRPRSKLCNTSNRDQSKQANPEQRQRAGFGNLLRRALAEGAAWNGRTARVRSERKRHGGDIES